jgi:hypothetical protein
MGVFFKKAKPTTMKVLEEWLEIKKYHMEW